MADRTELARAINEVAAALQRLAAALSTDDPAQPCPGYQPAHDGTYGRCVHCGRTWTEHRDALPAETAWPHRDPCSQFQVPPGGGYVCHRCGRDFLEHTEAQDNPSPPASVAEPECDCSVYARCDQHETTRPKGCKCNGPRFAAHDCAVVDRTGVAHSDLGHRHPERDPSLME